MKISVYYFIYVACIQSNLVKKGLYKKKVINNTNFCSFILQVHYYKLFFK